jgi:hypothetical protein
MKSMALVLALSSLATGAFAIDFSAGGTSVSYYVPDPGSSITRASMDLVGTDAPRTVTRPDAEATDSDSQATASYLAFADYGTYPIAPAAFRATDVDYDLTLAGIDNIVPSLTILQKTDYTGLWIKGGSGPDIKGTLQFNFWPEQVVGNNLLSKPENFNIMNAKAGRAADKSILDPVFELSSIFDLRL